MLLALLSVISIAQNRQTMDEFYAHEAKTLQEFISYGEKSIPDTNIDVKFYYLDLSISIDFPYIEGVVSCEFEPVANNLSEIRLSLNSALTVDDVTGDVSSFIQTGDSILISLDAAYDPGEQLEVIISYHGVPVEAGGYKGLRYETHHGVEPIIATLSTPYLAHYWYPCKDGPSDKPDSVYVDVTIPVQIVNGNEVIAVSNGMLENVIDNTSEKTYQWRHRYPIVTYYVMVAISNFVHFGESYAGIYGEEFPLDYYVFQQDLSASQAGVVDMPLALDVFSEKFGEYPFSDEKYGMTQLGFYGAIENQTNTITNNMFSSWFMVSVHELGHMWFGDNITCENWHHAWLNEGFASYSEALYTEETSGYAAYQQYMSGFEYYNGGTLYLENADDTFNVFQGIIYSKGAYALHMLRGVLDDSLFFESIYEYATHPDFIYSQATTEDFQEVCEQVSGEELGYFFDQWIYDEYFPEYHYNFENQGGEIAFVIKQVQGDQGRRPVFEMPMEVKLFYNSGGDTTVRVWNDEAYQVFTVSVPQSVGMMQVDPNDKILCQASYHPEIPVGTDDNKPLPGTLVNIYPNPVSENATMEIILPGNETVSMSLYDIHGRKLMFIDELQSGMHNFDRGALPSDIYFYAIRSKAGELLKSGKIVIQ